MRLYALENAKDSQERTCGREAVHLENKLEHFAAVFSTTRPFVQAGLASSEPQPWGDAFKRLWS
jgi:hypothetical protein